MSFWCKLLLERCSKSIDIAIVCVCDRNGVVVDDHSLAGRPVAACVRVFTGKLHEAVSEVSVVLNRLPTVINAFSVVHSKSLFRVELSAVEWVVMALHGGDEGVTGDGIRRGRRRRENLSKAFICREYIE